MTQLDRDKRAILTVLKQQGPSCAQTIKLFAGEFERFATAIHALTEEGKITMTIPACIPIYEAVA